MEQELTARLAGLEEKLAAALRRVDRLEKGQAALNRLATAVEVLATKQQAMESDVREIKVDVKALTGKPGKRWDAVVDKIVWALLAAVIAFLLGRIGL